MRKSPAAQPLRINPTEPRRLAQSPSALSFEVPPALSGEASSEVENRKLRTIVVPLDGTSFSEHALPAALAMARRSGASLRLIHAYSRWDFPEPWPMSSAPPWNSNCELEKQTYLSGIVKRIARVDHVPVETVLVDDANAVDALVRGSIGADLVVLASRRRNFASRLWWNSTFDGLRRHLSVPIHLVQGYSSPVDYTADPIARHILVPLDGSILSRSIVKHAARVARLEGAALTLLNVQNDDWTSSHFEHTDPRSYLTSEMQSLKSVSSMVDAHILTTNRSTVRAIASFAEQNDVDLIALATKSDHGLTRLMRGSIADSLIRQTKLPILLHNFDNCPHRPEVTTIA